MSDTADDYDPDEYMKQVEKHLALMRADLKGDGGTPPNTDYESDSREREFDPETEIKYQFRDKLGADAFKPPAKPKAKAKKKALSLEELMKARTAPYEPPSFAEGGEITTGDTYLDKYFQYAKTRKDYEAAVNKAIDERDNSVSDDSDLKALRKKWFQANPILDIFRHRARTNPKWQDEMADKPWGDVYRKWSPQSMVTGGKLTGPAPANPMKDNMTIKAQAGEYVVPKKVVDVLGSNYFDDMVTQITGKKPMPKPKGQTFTPGSNSNSPAFQTGGKVGAEGQTGDGWTEPSALPGTFGDPNNVSDSWQPGQQGGPQSPLFGFDSKGNQWSPYPGMEQYWKQYYDNPSNHYAGNWAGNPDDMVQINRGNRGGPGMAGPNDMANELGKRRQGRGGGRFSGPVFNQRSNLSARPSGYPLLQGYPQGSAPWDYGQNPSGVWGNAGNYNVSGESHKAGQDAMAFASNTWGQGMVHDPEVGMWRNENRPIAGQHVVETNPRFQTNRHAWNVAQRSGEYMRRNAGFFRGPKYSGRMWGGPQPALKLPQSPYPVAAGQGND